METTILTLESDRGTYYFDQNSKTGRVIISWHEKQVHKATNFEAALLWFISTHTDFRVVE